MILDPLLDLFRGRAVTIPPLDGAFRPNMALDEASVRLSVAAPDNLCARGDRLLFSSGPDLHTISQAAGPEPAIIATFDNPISALAVSPRGRIAVALDDGRLFIDGKEVALPVGLTCPTAIAFMGEDTLYLCNGSRACRPSDWVVDLMSANLLGSVWQLDLASGTVRPLASGLGFPQGVLPAPDGESVIVSESWRHRLLRVPLDGGKPIPVLEKLPGYPARLSQAAGGGAWLSLFAPRNRLVEFVLREQAYRHDMMTFVPRPYWISPSLASGTSFLEPLQCGGIKTMGIHKPWAPSRSYGLVARLDGGLRPVGSFHSRSNGTRHGVTSVVESGGSLLVGSKGGNAILMIHLSQGGA